MSDGAHIVCVIQLFENPPFGRVFEEVEGERKFDVTHRGEALTERSAGKSDK